MRLGRLQIRRTAMRCGFSLLLSSALWLCGPAWLHASDTAARRVLLVGQRSDPFLARVGAEIEKLGFSLVFNDAKEPLDAVARAERAVAALRVLPSRAGIEVWMADSTSGRSLLRQLVVDESPGGPDRELIALQTAELLRTSLLGEKSPSEHPAQAEASRAAPAEKAPAAEKTLPAEAAQAAAGPKNTGVQLACGALYSPGGARASVQLGVSLQRFFGARWGVGLDLSLPLRRGEMTGVEGSAKLGTYFAGALALLRFEPLASRFFATVGAGAAFLLLKYDGETSEPLRSSSGTRPTGAVYVRGDVGVKAASWLRFGVRALAGVSFQHMTVMFAGNEAGSFGPSFFAGFALAEVSFL